MDSAVLEVILKNGGIMGAVFLITVIPLALYTKKLASELKDTQDRRAVDAQQTVDKLIALNDKWNSTIAQHIRTVEAIDSTMKDVKNALTNLNDKWVGRISDQEKSTGAIESSLSEVKTTVNSVRDILMNRRE